MGPLHQSKTRGSSNPHKQNHPAFLSWTAGALPIPKRTHKLRDHTPVEEPICHIILLYQKEEWKASTSSRLLTGELVDHQNPLPPTPDPIADQLTMWLHPVHWIWHWVGIQRSPHQRERSMEGGIHNQQRPIQTNGHVLRPDQLPSHIPNNDEHKLPRPHWWRECNHLHGQHRHPHRTKTWGKQRRTSKATQGTDTACPQVTKDK